MPFKAKALRGKTYHTPRGFLIFNEGKTTENIPDEMRDRLVADRVIAGKAGALDRDSDGAAGGSEPAEPVALSGKNKAQLLEIAKAEGVTVDDGATNAAIVEAIEAKRAAGDGGAGGGSDGGAPAE